MPDHLHVFLRTDQSTDLSHWVGSLKKSLAAHWRTAGMRGPFWQAGFFDHLLRGHESYAEKWEYVRQNPVRAGLVSTIDAWPYASEIHPLQWDAL